MFKAEKATPKNYTTTGGLKTTLNPDHSYEIKKGGKVFARIPNHCENAKGVAEGIAEILNRERKLILPI